MTFRELLEKIHTYHFKVVIYSPTKEEKEMMFADNMIYLTHEYGNCEVMNVDCTTEIEKESSITHTIGIRPILLVTIREEK